MATVATVNRLKDLWGAERAEVDAALRRAGVQQNHVLRFHRELDTKKDKIEQTFRDIVGRDPQVTQVMQRNGLGSREYNEAAKAKARSIEKNKMAKECLYRALIR